MAPRSSTLAWKISWMEKPGGLQSTGLLRVRHDWATSLSLFTFMHWRRKWQPTPVFLPGESQGEPGTGEPGGLPSMGSHRVGHDWSDLAAAAAGYLGNYLYIFCFNCVHTHACPHVHNMSQCEIYFLLRITVKKVWNINHLSIINKSTYIVSCKCSHTNTEKYCLW